MTKTIIFTDLDGSLLHPKTYSFREAMTALELIRKKGIPLILCSSKTRAEMEVYRQRLQNKDPFVVENGGAIFTPIGYFASLTGARRVADYLVNEFGKPYDEIRRAFVSLRERLGISVQGFGDMTAAKLSRLSGLPVEEAALALLREFAEPFIFAQAPDRRFLSAIEEGGFKWTQGRFYYLMGDHDKGKAVRLLKKLFQSENGRLITIGLGDSLNDLPMLKEVSHPVLIAKEDGSHDPRVEVPRLIKTRSTGPAGWNSAVLELLKQ